MNIIDKIKKIFIKKQIEDKNVDTNIALFDVNDIFLPSFNQLSDNDKKKVLKYKQQIDINNLEQIIKYNQDTAKNGENITNLFIKYLYELKEITNKYGKTIDELNEENANLAIKNVKLIVLKEKLEALIHDSYLKTIAADISNQEYKNRKHEFVELFSRAARIKRNNQLKSLEELETRSKITIKTLEQQLMAMSNAIINNSIMINQIDIYNDLSNKLDDEDSLSQIYEKKLDFYTKVNIYLFEGNLPTGELGLYVFNTNIYGDRIIKLMAYIELEIDKYVFENKDKINDIFFQKLKEIESAIQTKTIKHQRQTLIKKINCLSILAQIFNDYIDKNYINNLYRYKFNILTNDINSSKEIIVPETKEELEVYKDILSEKITLIQKGIIFGINYIENKRIILPKLLKILKKYFYNDGYDYERILNNSFLLALLLSFDKKNGLSNFFNEYKFDHLRCHDNVDLVEDIFDWDLELSLETICRIMQVEKELNNRKEFPPFFELFNFCINYIDGFDDVRINSYMNEYKYTLPSGIISIEYSNYVGLKNNALIRKIRQYSSEKNVVFPSSIWKLSGAIFGNTPIKSITLNEGIKYIGPVVFVNQILKELTFPSSLESIEVNSFNYKEIENLTFLDFKNSKLLYNLLFSEDDKFKQVLFNLFACCYIASEGILITPYFYSLVLNDNDSNTTILCHQMDFKDTTGKREISLSMDDIPYIRENLIKVIKEKTGFDFKEYQKEKSLKK